MKVLVDLNVFLDVEQRRQPFFADSATVLNAALNGRITALLPTHSITTLFYVLERQLNAADAMRAVNWHLTHFQVPALDQATLKRAAALGFPDFEDAVVAALAEKAGCSHIVTRNVADFSASPVPTVSPTDFLSLLPAP